MSKGSVLQTDERLVGEARKRTQRMIERVTRDSEPDAESETAIEGGDPADTILEVLEDHPIDQVVMGGHGGECGSLSSDGGPDEATRSGCYGPVS